MKIKKLNSKGFGHLEILLVVAVVVVLGAVGYFVWQHEHKNNTAHAGSYTILVSSKGYSIGACKTYVNAYGGVYQVSAYFFKPASAPNYYYNISDYRGAGSNDNKGGQTGSAYLYNTVGGAGASASTYLNDRMSLGIVNNTRSFNGTDLVNAWINAPGAPNNHSWSQIANC